MAQPTRYFLAWRAKWSLTLPNARAQGDMPPHSRRAQHLWGKPRPSLQQVSRGLRWQWESGKAHGSLFPAELGQLRGVGPGRPRPASSPAAWVTVEAAHCHHQSSRCGPRPSAGRHQARGRRQKRTPGVGTGVGGLVGAKQRLFFQAVLEGQCSRPHPCRTCPHRTRGASRELTLQLPLQGVRELLLVHLLLLLLDPGIGDRVAPGERTSQHHRGESPQAHSPPCHHQIPGL